MYPQILLGPLDLTWAALQYARVCPGVDVGRSLSIRIRGDSELHVLQKSLELFRAAKSNSVHNIAFSAGIMLRTNSSDPRDKVYALVGLLGPSLGTYIQPNDDRPVADTFIATTKASILSTELLNVLAFAGHNGTHASTWPSWVFDCSLTLGDELFTKGLFQHSDDAVGWTLFNPTKTVNCGFGLETEL